MMGQYERVETRVELPLASEIDEREGYNEKNALGIKQAPARRKSRVVNSMNIKLDELFLIKQNSESSSSSSSHKSLAHSEDNVYLAPYHLKTANIKSSSSREISTSNRSLKNSSGNLFAKGKREGVISSNTAILVSKDSPNSKDSQALLSVEVTSVIHLLLEPDK